MDDTLETLVDYVKSLRYEDIPQDVVHQVKRAYVDSIGCMIGGGTSDPATVARRMAADVVGTLPGRILGGESTTSIEAAAFANGVMLRYLDYNDMYMAQRDNNGHPSDMIAGVLTLAGALHRPGKDAIAATALAYEVFCSLAENCPLIHFGGWDRGVFSVIGTACATSWLMRLDAKQLAHAISLAVVPNVPLAVTRTGALSMWKGCALAISTRAGIYAAELAKYGMTGPSEPFIGRGGLWQQVMRAELAPPVLRSPPSCVLDTFFKWFPAEWHTQCPIWVAGELHRQVAFEDITRVVVHTYHAAIRTAGDAAKWHPETRESADHSIPYVVAIALRDGSVSVQSFEKHQLADAALLRLVSKVEIVQDAYFDSSYPSELNCRIELETKSGRRYEAHASFPKGHRQWPLTDAEISEKYLRLTGSLLARDRQERMLKELWAFDLMADVDSLFECCSGILPVIDYESMEP